LGVIVRQPVAHRVARHVIDDAVAACVLPSHDRRAVRRADRRGMERALKERALARDPVDLRCLHVRMTACAEFVVAQVVDQDDDEVRTSFFHLRGFRPPSSVGISSDTVGWMCTARWIVVYGFFAYIMSSREWTISSALSPSSAAPSSSFESASTSTFMNPCVSPASRARPTRLIGIFAASTRLPLLRASASFIPARPSGGSMESAYAGIRSDTRRRLPSNRFAVTIS